MTKKYKAFDLFIEETEEAPKGFAYKGENYDLPLKLPAKVMLRGMRKQKDTDNAQDGVAEYEEFFVDLLGKEQYERLLDTKISLPELNSLFTFILSLYTETNNADPKASAQE